MGNSILAQIQEQLGNQQYQWQTISSSSYSSKLRDRKSGIMAERHHIELKEVEEQYKTYLLRHRFSQYLVDVYQISQESPSALCKMNQEVSIVIEYIPYRLCDLGTITLEEGLYVMSCILRACEILKHNQVQFYLLDETNICFNSKGQCKYWINELLHLSRPPRMRVVSEQHFVMALWEIVQQRVNEINSFFLQDPTQGIELTVENMKRMVDKALTIKLVALPSITNLHADRSPPRNIFTEDEVFPLKSQREECKKVSLTNYNSKYKLHEEPSSHPSKNSGQKQRSQGILTPKKSLSNREKLSNESFQQNLMGAIQMKKGSTNNFNQHLEPIPIDPYYSVLMVSPVRATRHQHERYASNPRVRGLMEANAPKLKFSYNNPGNLFSGSER